MQDNYDIFIYIVTGILVGLLAIWNLLIQKKIKDFNDIKDIFFKGDKAVDLESIIIGQKKKISDLTQVVGHLNKKIDEAKQVADTGIQKVGMVRYDTFKDKGGKQSFSVALLNKQNDGIVLSSLNNRDGSRVFTKPIEKANSKITLSEQEKVAVEKAVVNKGGAGEEG
jgi:hypothetical protein